MNVSGTCPECGKPVAPNALQGLCPECMLKVGLSAQTGEAGPVGESQPSPPLSVAEVAKLFPQLDIIEALGCGGMGAVYKARQPRLDRLVALKILTRGRADETRDQRFVERFEREARALAKLNHPNIVAVYEFGEAGGLPYLILEYVDGVNLRQLERAGKLSPVQALKVVPQICDALQFAHDADVVHRDIKPENILLDQQGRVKIADFGIAKILGREGRSLTLTERQQVIGTPHYMAPEQVERPAEVDHRADIYSLGVVFYEMLTGELPLGKFAPPSSRMGGVQVDVRLDEVVLRALEKLPERRYQSASEVKTDVEVIAGGTGQASRQTASRQQTEESASPAQPRRWMIKHGFIPSILPAALFLLPPILLTIFVLVGHRWFGLDLDADIQSFTGILGLPLSAGVGALLAWGVSSFMGTPPAWSQGPARCGERAPPAGKGSPSMESRWSRLALGAAVVLGLSLPLGGGAMVLLQLASTDRVWNPGSEELVVTGLLVGGALLSAMAATLMGFESLRQIRRAPEPLRGRPGALAAAWFWPCVLGCVAMLWSAKTGLGTRSAGARGYLPEYETMPVTRGALSMVVMEAGRLSPASDDTSRWRIDARVPEASVGNIEVGQEVDCVADAFPGRAFKGKVVQVGSEPELGRETTTYNAVIQVADSELPFKRGMSVVLKFIIAHRQDTLRIPSRALLFHMPGTPPDSTDLRFGLTPRELAMADAAELATRTVWVVRDARLTQPEPVNIRIGISNGTWTEVVEGLSEGEHVVMGISDRARAPRQSPENAIITKSSAYDRREAVFKPGLTDASSMAGADDVASVSAEERWAGGDPNQRFFLLGPKQGETPPTNGCPLLLVLPGGDGGAGFLTFIKRIYLHAVPRHYLVAELIAPQWDEKQAERMVWPTESAPYPAMKFSTEAFVAAVISDIEKQHRFDARRIYTLSWSSGGRAGYAASLAPGTRVTGSFIAMSVFQPQRLPDLNAARGHAYYLLHSAEDRMIPLSMATQARDSLAANGAQATLATYEGGHGWHGDVYGNIRAGLLWLERQTTMAAGNATGKASDD